MLVSPLAVGLDIPLSRELRSESIKALIKYVDVTALMISRSSIFH